MERLGSYNTHLCKYTHTHTLCSNRISGSLEGVPLIECSGISSYSWGLKAYWGPSPQKPLSQCKTSVWGVGDPFPHLRNARSSRQSSYPPAQRCHINRVIISFIIQIWTVIRRILNNYIKYRTTIIYQECLTKLGLSPVHLKLGNTWLIKNTHKKMSS